MSHHPDPDHPLATALGSEIRREARTTRKLLERIPPERLGWKPHPRSLSLGQLALHIASTPRAVIEMLSGEAFDARRLFGEALGEPGSVEEITSELDRGIEEALEALATWGDGGLDQPWRLEKDGKTVSSGPRGIVARNLLCGHVYHHRGQLTVYLRLLDVPLPSIYGPSADEDPYAHA